MDRRLTWSHEQDTLLGCMYSAGDDVAYIASSLGRSVSSVKTRVATLGLLRRRIDRSSVPSRYRRKPEGIERELLHHPCFAS